MAKKIAHKFFVQLYLSALLFCVFPLSGVYSQEKFSFCEFPSISSGSIELARVKGFLAEEGLTADVHHTLNGKICLDELVAKRVDFTSFADAPYVYASSGQEIPVKILAAIKYVDGGTIIGRRSHGIQSFESLADKAIGYLPGTVSSIFIYNLFEEFNLPAAKIKLLKLQQPAMVQAITGGQIDAISSWEPWTSNAMENLGADGIKLKQPELYKFHHLLGVHEDNVTAKKPAIKKLLNALIKVEKFIDNNPLEAARILSVFLKIKESSIIEEFKDSVTKIALPAELLPLMDRTYKLIKKYEPNLESDIKPDYRKSFYIDPLTEISPDRVDPAWITQK